MILLLRIILNKQARNSICIYLSYVHNIILHQNSERKLSVIYCECQPLSFLGHLSAKDNQPSYRADIRIEVKCLLNIFGEK